MEDHADRSALLYNDALTSFFLPDTFALLDYAEETYGS
jgi:hypothetical protein